MRVAMVEFETVWENPPQNRQKLLDEVPAGVDLAVFPELTFSGFTMDPVTDPAAEGFLCELAADRTTALVAGYIADGPRNRAVAIDAQGSVQARYDKLHPFTFAGEDRCYEAGSDLPVFQIGGATAALLICYDLRFPEPFREAALRGAQMLVVPANWPARRIDHWHALLRARAIENQAFVFGVNRVGSDPNEQYVSSSLAVAPDGRVLHEGAGMVDIDIEESARARDAFPMLRDVRTDRYRYPTDRV